MKISTRLRHISRLLAFVTILAVFNSCGQEDDPLPLPRADFTFTKAENCKAPCAVKFESNSENARGYNWDFGDGQSSTEPNPTHTYRAGGNFTITLTAAGDGGIDKMSKPITIESTATKMVIKRVILEEMPLNTPTGSGWDNSDGPDVYFKFKGPAPDTTTLVNTSDRIFLDMMLNSLPVEWEFVVPQPELLPLDRDFNIELWDLDFSGDTDDMMSFVKFRPSSFVKLGTPEPYPASIEVEGNGLKLTIEVEWQ